MLARSLTHRVEGGGQPLVALEYHDGLPCVNGSPEHRHKPLPLLVVLAPVLRPGEQDLETPQTNKPNKNIPGMRMVHPVSTFFSGVGSCRWD